MKIKPPVAALTAAAVIGVTMLAGSGPALAIDEINTWSCSLEQYDYFAIHDDSPTPPRIWRCFANAGDTYVNSTHVGGFKSGNNKGWFEYEPGDGWRYRHYFNKFDSRDQNYWYVGTLHINTCQEGC